MRKVKVAATQMACSTNIDENVDKAVELIIRASREDANFVLIQELFENEYFCKDQKDEYFNFAKPFTNHPLISKMTKIAKEYNVVLPISYFEKANKAYFNSVAIIDADGEILGNYRKSHIPDGPGYQEKFYFSPGDTGFKVWNTKFAKIGVGICWDQWSSEAARIMALMGAEIIFYPTAIGSEPEDPDDFDSSYMWQRAMIGHSACNQVPVVASNRIGAEKGEVCTNYFYGRSFISDYKSDILAEGSRDKEEVLLASIDLEAAESFRRTWGIFRDRRPDLYKPILNLSGNED